ncbi:hypothetical protein ACFQY0_21320 [Haloferula chungangensis]|uniref:Uncharacterized protein n=1 Tax=Haloferula chungangensis TaxID=1048331 RepID=A0ABW2LB83_9BACT
MESEEADNGKANPFSSKGFSVYRMELRNKGKLLAKETALFEDFQKPSKVKGVEKCALLVVDEDLKLGRLVEILKTIEPYCNERFLLVDKKQEE